MLPPGDGPGAGQSFSLSQVGVRERAVWLPSTLSNVLICSRDSWEKSRPEVEDVAGSHLGERLLQIDQERTDLPFKGAWAPRFLSLHPAQVWAAALGPGLVHGLLAAHTLSLPPHFPSDQEEHLPRGSGMGGWLTQPLPAQQFYSL